jgi:hypothetical protein
VVGCKDGGVRLINLDSGRAVLDLWQVEGKQPPGAFSAINRAPLFAVSRDGRMLALRSPDDGATRVLEVASGKERLTLPSQESVVTCLGFAQEGLHLVTGSQNSTVLVWALNATGKVKLGDTEKSRAWQLLANDDAARAFETMRRLLADPDGAVRLLHEQLKPTPAPDASIVQKRIRDLDSTNFTTRQKAQDALIEMGEPIRLAVEKAAADRDASSELRQRADAILQRIDQASPTSDRLRELRALELLERIASPAACVLLRSLAQGAPGAALTRDAQASLDRLLATPRVERN